MLWKLATGEVVGRDQIKRIVIGDSIHSPKILDARHLTFLAQNNIYPFVEISYQERDFDSTGYTDLLIEGVVTRTHTLEPKRTLAAAKKRFAGVIRNRARELLIHARYEYEYLMEFEPASAELAKWVTYKAEFKAAIQSIKAEVIAINDYQTFIDYVDSGWRSLLPVPPTAEVI